MRIAKGMLYLKLQLVNQKKKWCRSFQRAVCMRGVHRETVVNVKKKMSSKSGFSKRFDLNCDKQGPI